MHIYILWSRCHGLLRIVVNFRSTCLSLFISEIVLKLCVLQLTADAVLSSSYKNNLIRHCFQFSYAVFVGQPSGYYVTQQNQVYCFSCWSNVPSWNIPYLFTLSCLQQVGCSICIVWFRRLVGFTNHSRKSNMEYNSTSDVIILSGNSHPELADLIAK